MKITFFLWLVLSFLSLYAQPKEATENELAGVLYPYPYIDSVPNLSPSPEGYVPFHIEHYGRHGSRWMLNEEDYSIPVRNLELAQKAGKLTPLGIETLEYLRQLQRKSKGNLGKLTEKGGRQHQLIGRRMVQNFPEIFVKEADLSAKSTTVDRCIRSMKNALEGIVQIAPGLSFSIDASEKNMWFMNYKDKTALEIRDSINKTILNAYRDSIMQNSSYISRLVSDEKFAKEKVEPGLLPRFYWALSSGRNNDDNPLILEKVFGHEDLLKNWNYGNARRFLLGGNSGITYGRMPYSQRNLLQRILDTSDAAIESDKPSANLRFGHDDVLMPLIVLMELQDFGKEINSFQELETSGWHDYEITPMAGNLQLIFYRRAGDHSPEDILVKALINETEVTMPGTPVSGYYYRWVDIRDYYKSKLEKQFPL